MFLFVHSTNYQLHTTNYKNRNARREAGRFLSVKNEGYNYVPLCRHVLRRVEQYTRRLRFRLLSTLLLNYINMKTV